MRELPPEIRDSALTVLRDATLWRLSPARWELLADLLDVAVAAHGAGDSAGLDAATARLEAAGPVRITRIGAPLGEPAPPAVRERLNHLIHALSGSGEDAVAREDAPSGAPRPGDRP